MDHILKLLCIQILHCLRLDNTELLDIEILCKMNVRKVANVYNHVSLIYKRIQPQVKQFQRHAYPGIVMCYFTFYLIY